MKILTVTQMMEVDRLSTEECGIPSILLMENAGMHCFRALEEEFSADLAELQIVLVCGKGNNGGDGMVVARQLLQQAAPAQVFLLGRQSQIAGDSAVNATILVQSGQFIHEVVDEPQLALLESALETCDIVVDALLGTGLSKPLTGRYARAVEAINRCPGFRLAVDIPSGMAADSVMSSGLSVWADRTVTFTAPKVAHVMSEDMERLGQLEVVPIGSPVALLEKEDYFLELIDEQRAADCLFARLPNSHKGDYGHLLLLAGSRGKSGAAAMAAHAAFRTGVGLVTLVVPRGIQSEAAAANPEVMTEGLAEDELGAFDSTAWEELRPLLQGKSALAIGPGLSLRSGAAGLVRRVLEESQLPVVLDAGGVDALRDHVDLLSRRQAPLILTPHLGEFSRLTGTPTSEIATRGIALARDFAREYGVWLVLKGFRTLLADPQGRVRVCPLGNPGMATAGMGDVLTGVIGGLFAGHAAQGTSQGALAAASAGLYLHSLAGDLAASEIGMDGMMAGDVIDCIPDAVAQLRD